MSSTGILFGIIALAAFGALRVPQWLLIRRVGVYTALLASYAVEFTLLLLAAVLGLASGAAFPVPSLPLVLLIALLGVLGAGGIAAFYRASQLGHISVVSAIAQAFVLLTVLLSIVVLGERPTLLNGIGVALTISGAVLVSFRWRELRGLHFRHAAAGVPFALLTALFWGLFFFLYKFVVTAVGVLPAAFLTEGAIFAVFLLCLLRLRPRTLDRKSWGYAALTGTGIAVGALAYNAAISMSFVSLAASLMAASPLVTAALARLVLRERLDTNQYAGIGLAVIGIILLSL